MGDCLTEKQAEPETYGEIFDRIFPEYLVMGMTPEQFWDGESWLKKSYRDAYRIRMRNEERVRDIEAWLQGAYIREALASVPLLVNGFVPRGAKTLDYPKQPRIIQQEEEKKAADKKKKQEHQMQLAMAMFQSMISEFNRGFEKKNGDKTKAT